MHREGLSSVVVDYAMQSCYEGKQALPRITFMLVPS